MTRLMTSAEYCCPVDTDLPEETFVKIENLGRVRLDADLRARVCELAYFLADGLYRELARPSATDCINELLRLAERAEANLEKTRRRGRGKKKTVKSQVRDEATWSLLEPLFKLELGVSCLLPLAREEHSLKFAVAVRRLAAQFSETYDCKRGRHTDLAIDEFVRQLHDVYIAAGGMPSASYRARDEDRNVPFVMLVWCVAQAALEIFAPDIPAAEKERDIGLRKDLMRLRDALAAPALGRRISRFLCQHQSA